MVSIKNNHLVHNDEKIKIRDHFNNANLQDIFDDACQKGDLYIVKKLIEWAPDNININSDDNYPFLIACQNDHPDTVKCIIDWKPEETKQIIEDKAFYIVCLNGHLELIKQFVEKNPKNLIPQLLESLDVTDEEKIDILRPIMARIKIKWWIIGYLYNRAFKIGRWYTDKYLLEDNELINN